MVTNKSPIVLLKSLYASNFVTYYKAHAFHLILRFKVALIIQCSLDNDTM